MSEVAQDADAVVEADEDRALLRNGFAVIHRHAAGAEREAAAVDPDHHRQLRARCRILTRPDVEIEAVLAGRLLAEIVVEIVPAQHLDALARQTIGVIIALPRLVLLRRAPA